jgi:hypothetical protein
MYAGCSLLLEVRVIEESDNSKTAPMSQEDSLQSQLQEEELILLNNDYY